MARFLEHIVLFRLKPETTAAQEAELIRRLRALKDQIPGIIELTAGRNVRDVSHGYTVGLIVRLRDLDALEAYRAHPAHQEILRYIEEVTETRLAVDYYTAD